jgi:hypothetical protein
VSRSVSHLWYQLFTACLLSYKYIVPMISHHAPLGSRNLWYYLSKALVYLHYVCHMS